MRQEIRFSSDGKFVFHASTQFVRVWRERQFVGEYAGELIGIARDGETLLTRHPKEKTFHAWRSETGSAIELSTLMPEMYAPNQRYYIEGKRMTLTLHDVLGIEMPHTLEFGTSENSACDRWSLSPDGTRLAIAFVFDAGGHDAAWGTCYNMQAVKQFDFNIDRFVFFPLVDFVEHHPLLVVSSGTNAITLHLMHGGKPIHRFQYERMGGDFLKVSPHSQDLIALHLNRDVWRLYRGAKKREVTEEQPVRSVAFHPDGEHIASLINDGTIRVYELDTLQLDYELRVQA